MLLPSELRSILLWLPFAAATVGTCPGTTDAGEASLRYELATESAYTFGCFDPCRCPIFSTQGVTGSLVLSLRESDPLFDHYDVSDVSWSVPVDPPLRVSGSGTYSIGGEVALTHRLILDLEVGDEPVQHFDSGMLAGGARFPGAFDVTISVNGMVCLDTVFEVRARQRLGSKSQFERGDCNADAGTDISDGVTALLFLFSGGEQPPCIDACDSNDDGELNLSDAIYLLSHLFLGGPLPPAPIDSCGSDPTPDVLDCASFPACDTSCRQAVEAIAEESAIVGSCSTVVRLDHDSRKILGWQMSCGRYTQVDERLARELAQRDSGYGSSGRMLNEENPEDLFVFYESPGDFGGVGVVSARNGLSVFGGSIIWLGRGDITYPESWRPTDSLPADCLPADRRIPVRSYDLVQGGEPLDAKIIDELLDIVWRTALPEGLETSSDLFDVVVLRYPRSVGAFDPGTAEWIVIVNSGWLE